MQKALDEQGIEYEIERLSGQPKYPIIEFEDGSVCREESKDMAATIKAGTLSEKQGAGQPAG